MKELISSIAMGIATLAAVCAEIIGCGYYFAWVYTIGNGSVQAGFGFAGVVAILAIVGTTGLGGLAISAMLANGEI